MLDEIAQILARLKADGTTMLMVEQNIGLACAVSDRFHVRGDGAVADTGAMGADGVGAAELARRIYR